MDLDYARGDGGVAFDDDDCWPVFFQRVPDLPVPRINIY